MNTVCGACSAHTRLRRTSHTRFLRRISWSSLHVFFAIAFLLLHTGSSYSSVKLIHYNTQQKGLSMSINYESFGGKRGSWKDKKRWGKKRPLPTASPPIDLSNPLTSLTHTPRVPGAHFNIFVELVHLLKRTASKLHLTTETITIEGPTSSETAYIGKKRSILSTNGDARADGADGNGSGESAADGERRSREQAAVMEAELRKCIRGMFRGAPPAVG